MGTLGTVVREDRLSPAAYELLPRSGRAIIQLLLGRGGSASLGYGNIATALNLSEKTVELMLPRLCSAGWVTVTRQRRRPAIVGLTEEARKALATAGGLSLTIARHIAATPVAGFLGDPIALDRAEKLLLKKDHATAADLAAIYLEEADPNETARIHSMLDDFDSIPLEISVITGYERLDNGLRDHFEIKARRHLSRKGWRKFLGFDD